MSASKGSQRDELMVVGALGGLAGGLTEIGWIWAYGTATGTPTIPVARGIVESTIPAVAASSWAPALGILIHLALAVVLGIGLAIAVRQFTHARADRFSVFGIAIVVLAAVWSVNFLLILPYLNPDFVHLLPYGVTLLSKLLFGVSAAAMLRAKGFCQ